MTRTFMLQIDKAGTMDIDLAILKNELKNQRYGNRNDIKEISLYALKNLELKNFKNIIPVGSLEYVGYFLKQYYGIETMEPIEIPKCLRQWKYLRREYRFVRKENIPKDGVWFIKNVSRLKEMSVCGPVSMLHYMDLEKNAWYQVSSPIDIIAEWRCFVHRGKLVGIACYDFDKENPKGIFPDMILILEMMDVYQKDPCVPLAYTMDIAVTTTGHTVLLEVHPWVSVGLYNYIVMDNLCECYVDGFTWYTKCNRGIPTELTNTNGQAVGLKNNPE